MTIAIATLLENEFSECLLPHLVFFVKLWAEVAKFSIWIKSHEMVILWIRIYINIEYKVHI